MGSQEVRQEIDRLQQEVQALEADESDAEARLAARRAELDEYEGRLALTRRAIADHQERLADKREELKNAITAEARQLLEKTVERREQAATSVAEAVNVLLERFDGFERLSDETQNAWAAWASREGKLVAHRSEAVDSWPGALEDAWGRLSALVRNLNEQREQDLVEAAARSRRGFAIKDLPPHLQELARERRSGLLPPTKRTAKPSQR
jgi:chromosome segregation ATPase